jgi:hypothetical protein
MAKKIDPRDMPEGPEPELAPVAVLAAPAPDLLVSARQYTIARGKRWERCGGFLHWAEAQFGSGARKSIREWEARWSEFLSAPITG